MPIAVIGNLLFPSLAMLFFVIPQRTVADDPLVATAAIAQLGMFAVMSTCLFTFGVGRLGGPRDAVRPVPAHAARRGGPRLAGRVLNGVIWSYLALVPLVVIGALLTAATLSPTQALGAVALVARGRGAVPAARAGDRLPAQLEGGDRGGAGELFPLAFAGGLFLPPQAFPAWLDTLSTFLPSRAARDLVVQVITGEAAYAYALPGDPARGRPCSPPSRSPPTAPTRAAASTDPAAPAVPGIQRFRRRIVGTGSESRGAGGGGQEKRRRRRELPTTRTDESAIAAPAIIGLSRPNAASGIAATL